MLKRKRLDEVYEGLVFSFWNRLFATYSKTSGREGVISGVLAYNEDMSVKELLLSSWSIRERQ